MSVTDLPTRKRDGREGWVRELLEHRDRPEYRNALLAQVVFADYLAEDELLFGWLVVEMALRLGREGPTEGSRAQWRAVSDALGTAMSRENWREEDGAGPYPVDD